MSTEKFTEGAKTFRLFMILIMVIVVAGVTYMIFHPGIEHKATMNIENLRLAKCREVVVAKGICNLKAEISEAKTIGGLTMPSFAPGSKSVSYNGPVTMRFGYDSTTPLFPKGTVFEPNISGAGSNAFIIRIPSAPKPKVLPDASVKGYAHESKSYFTGDIPPETFFGYLDSLVVVAGNRTIEGNPDYFNIAYANMVYDLVASLMGSRNSVIIEIDHEMYDADSVKTQNTQNFVEDIAASKRL